MSQHEAYDPFRERYYDCGGHCYPADADPNEYVHAGFPDTDYGDDSADSLSGRFPNPRLETIRARHAAATPGPWFNGREAFDAPAPYGDCHGCEMNREHRARLDANGYSHIDAGYPLIRVEGHGEEAVHVHEEQILHNWIVTGDPNIDAPGWNGTVITGNDWSGNGGVQSGEADSTFIVNAPTDVAWLLAELDAVRAETAAVLDTDDYTDNTRLDFEFVIHHGTGSDAWDNIARLMRLRHRVGIDPTQDIDSLRYLIKHWTLLGNLDDDVAEAEALLATISVPTR